MSQQSIKSITFTNFKALVDTTLPLGPLTLIVGPNGAGKSTALQGIEYLARRVSHAGEHSLLQSAETIDQNDHLPQLCVSWSNTSIVRRSLLKWAKGRNCSLEHLGDVPINNVVSVSSELDLLDRMRVFSLNPTEIEKDVVLQPNMELASDGFGLAGVLDRLRDGHPERWDTLNFELARWLPEFDRVLFDTPIQGHRSIRLRTRQGQHSIPASQLSQGTLLALAMLTLAYLPTPPSLIGIEEPDRGIHPRLLREVRDALYRLAYPKSFGESRPPVQVIATTQNPYFLQQFQEHPEEIVIAEKKGLRAVFTKLDVHPHLNEILSQSPLGEVWYSGILGGIPLPV